jgi:two-component SAPR family response regulator
MPKMHGFELYREIRKIDDEVKVCFLTAGEMYSGAYYDKQGKSNDQFIMVITTITLTNQQGMFG